MAFRESSDARVRYGRFLGLLFVLAGFVSIGVAWNGAAGRACVDCQFPYILSGGFGGLALVVLGSALLFVSGLRAERLHLEHALKEARPAAGIALPAPADASTGELTAVGTGTDGRVVAGRSSYHRLDCRLVKGKTGLETMSAEQASARGLAACRVCNPAKADQAGATR